MSSIYKEPLRVLKQLFFILTLMFSLVLGASAADAAAGDIGGVIYNEVDGIAGFTTGVDFPVSGATVTLTKPDNSTLTATTGADGKYLFSGLATPADYKILVTAPAGYTPLNTVAQTVSLLSSGSNTAAHWGLKGTGGAILGFVFNDKDRNVAFGGTDVGLGNIQVTLKNSGGSVISTIYTKALGSVGSYTFQNLPPGQAYTVEVGVGNTDLGDDGFGLVSTSDGTAATPKRIISIASGALSGGNTLSNKNFAATELTTGVDGYVFINVNNRDKAYIAGEDLFLEGAGISIFYSDGTTLVPNVTITTTGVAGKTGTDGVYQIKNLPKWNYIIKMAPPSAYTAKGATPEAQMSGVSGLKLDLNPDDPLQPVSNYLFYVEGNTGAPGISGQVFGFSNSTFASSPLTAGPDGGGTFYAKPSSTSTQFENVKITLMKAGVPYLTQTTQTGGTYNFIGIPAGTYNVKIDPAQIPTGYHFMNDRDGKSAVKGNTPEEIKNITIAGTTRQNDQNFWYGLQGTAKMGATIAIKAMWNESNWGGAVNGVPGNGYGMPGTVTLLEEDGVTRARGSDGVLIPPIVLNAYGGLQGLHFSSTVLPGLYKFSTSGLDSRVSRTNPDELYQTGLTSDATIYPQVTVAGNPSNRITGRAYIDVDGVAGYNSAAGDVPLYQIRVSLQSLTAVGAVEYTGAYTGSASDGTYDFTNLPNGKYKVILDYFENAANGYGTQITPFSDPDGIGTAHSYIVEVTGGQSKNGDFVYKSNNKEFYIDGYTWMDIYAIGSLETFHSNGIFDLLFGKVKIELLTAAGAPVLSGGTPVVVYSNDNGYFKIKGTYLAANTTYKIRASKADMSVVTIGGVGGGGAERTISLGASPSSMIFTAQNFLLQGPGSFVGNIMFDYAGTGLGNSAAPNCNWWFSTEKVPGSGTFDKDLRFQWNLSGYPVFYGLEPGNYQLRSSYGTAWADVNPATAVGTINFTIPKGGAPNSYKLTQQNVIVSNVPVAVSGSLYWDISGSGSFDAASVKATTLTGTGIKAYRTSQFLTNYNLAANLATAVNNPVTTTTVNAAGDYSFNITNNNILIALDEAALTSAGYTVVNNSTGAVPHGTNAALPVKMKTMATIQVGAMPSTLIEQNYLLRRIKPVEISGRVFYDFDYDDQDMSPEDTGINGQVIQLWNSAGTTMITSVAVDSNGYYKFTNVPNGTYTIKIDSTKIDSTKYVQAPNSISKARRPNITAAGGNFEKLDFWYRQAGEAGIAGNVVLDLNNNGAPDLGTDYKFSGVLVTLTAPGFPTKTTTTNNNGFFKFSELVAGKIYTVTLTSGYDATKYSVFKTFVGTTTVPTQDVNMASAQMYPGRFFLLKGDTNPTPGGTTSGASGYLYKGNSITVPVGNRLAGINVQLSDATTVYGTFTSDANGFFQFHNLASGTYKITPLNVPATLAILGDADGLPFGEITVTLAKGSGKANQNFWYADKSAAGITGTVYYDVNNDSTITAGTDRVIPTINVELYDTTIPASPVLVKTVPTNSIGQYAFPNIPTTSYKVKVKDADKTAKGFVDRLPSTPGEIAIPSLPVAGAAGKDFLLGGARSLSGSIQKDVNGDGIVNATDPVATAALSNIDTVLVWAGPDGSLGTPDDVTFGSNATAVTGYTPNHIVAIGMTDTNGQYTYSNLPAGLYKVDYNKTSPTLTDLALIELTVMPANTTAPRQVTLASTNLTNVNFAYEPLGGFTGRITYDTNGNSGYDASDMGLTGVSVELLKWNATTSKFESFATPKLFTTITKNISSVDVTGYYEFDGIPLGKYQVVPAVGATYIPAYEIKENLGTVTLDGKLSRELKASGEDDWHLGFKGTTGSIPTALFKSRKDSLAPGFTYDPANPTDNTKNDPALANLQVKIKGTSVSKIEGIFTTGSDGNFTMKNLPADTYTFEVVTSSIPAGFVGAYDSSNPSNTTGTFSIALTPANTAGAPYHPYVGYKLTGVTGGFSLAGIISIDADNSNSYTAGEPGISGVKIQLLKKNGTTYEPVANTLTTGTLADGKYSFSGLAAGDYKIQLLDVSTYYLPKYNAVKFGNLYESTGIATIGPNKSDYHIGFAGDSTTRNVDVVVRFDNNQNNAFDASNTVDTPAQGFTVTLTSASKNYTQTAVSDAAGLAKYFAIPFAADYAVTITPTANYKVVYNGAGASSAVTITNFNITTATGTDVKKDSPIFGLVGNATPPSGAAKIEGYVVFDTGNTLGSKDANDTPVPTVGIKLSYFVTGVGYVPISSPVVQTGADGKYSATSLSATTSYRVDLIRNAALTGATLIFSPTASQEFHIGNASTAATPPSWDFGYDAAGGVNLTIQTYKDTNLDGASTGDTLLGNRYITLARSGVTITYQTKADGTLVLHKMLPGTYVLDAGAGNTGYIKSYVEGSPIALVTGYTDIPKVGFREDTAGSSKISGRVIFDKNANSIIDDPGDSGLVGIVLKLYTSSGTFTGKTYTTDLDGSYLFENLKEGLTYYFKIEDGTSQGKLANYTQSFGLDGTDKFKSANIPLANTVGSQATHNAGYKGDKAANHGRDMTVDVRYDTNLSATYESSLVLDYPIQGMIVKISSASLAMTGAQVTTDATGKAVFANMPYGTDYVIQVDPAPAAAPIISYSGSTVIGKDATPATPKTGYEIKGDLDIPYFGFKAATPPSGVAKIEGTVVLDTGSIANQLDSADARIEGATVVLSYADPNGNFVPAGSAQITLVDGKYSFTALDGTKRYRVEVISTSALPASDYDAAFTKAGASTSWFYASTAAIGGSQVWDFGFKVKGGKGKNVTLETYLDNGTTDSAWDSGDTLFGPFTITLKGTTDQGVKITGTYITPVGGTVLVTNLPYNTTGYTVTNVGTPGYVAKYGPTTVAVDSTNPTPNPRFGYSQDTSGGGTITGKVYFDQDGNSTYTAGEGIQGILFSLYSKSGSVYSKVNTSSYTVTTSVVDGSYTLGGLADGTYELRVEDSASKLKIQSYQVVEGLKTGDIYKSIDITVTSGIASQNIGYKGSTTPGSTARDLIVWTRNDSDGNNKYDGTDNNEDAVSIKISSVKLGISLNPQTTTGGQTTFVGLGYSDDYEITATKTDRTAVYDNDHNPLAGANGTITYNLKAKVADPLKDNGFFGFKKAAPLTGSLTISGKVVADTGITLGSLDAYDMGLGGITLALQVEENGAYTFVKTEVTNSDGTYAFTGSESGKKYKVTVVSGVPSTYTIKFNKALVAQNYYEATVSSSDNTWHFGYTVPAGAKTKTTFAINAYTDDGATPFAYDSGEPGLSGIQIRLSGKTIDGNQVDQVYTTDSTGKIPFVSFPMSDSTGYTFESASANDAGFEFRYSSSGSPVNGKSFTEVVNGSTPTGNKPYFGYLVKAPTGDLAIKGKVLFEVDNFGATSSVNDVPLANINLQILIANSSGVYQSSSIANVQTDANGEFKFDNLGASKYQVKIVGGLPANAIDSYRKLDGTDLGSGGKTIEKELFTTSSSNVMEFGVKGDLSPAKSRDMTLKAFYDSNDNGIYEALPIDGNQAGMQIRITGGIFGSIGKVYDVTMPAGTLLAKLPYGNYTLTSENHSSKNMKVVYHQSGNNSATENYGVTIDNSYSTGAEYFGYFNNVIGSLKISGRVVLDSDGSGAYTTPTSPSPHDIGISGLTVTVLLKEPNPSTTYNSVKVLTTGADGSYSYNEAARGHNYKVVVTKSSGMAAMNPVFTKLTDPGSLEISGDISGSVTNWNFGFADPINGTIEIHTRKDDGNMKYDGATTIDAVYANMPLKVEGGIINDTYTTDANGILKIQGLSVNIGNYKVTVDPANTLTSSIVVYNDETVVGSMSGVAKDVTFSLSSTTTKLVPYGIIEKTALSGKVVLDINLNKQMDNTIDKPLVGATVKATYMLSGVPTGVTKTTTTLADGTYKFDDLTSGDWRIQVTAIPAPYTTAVESSFEGPRPNDGNTLIGYLDYTLTSTGVNNAHFGFYGKTGQSTASGTIYYDYNSEGIHNPTQDFPIAEVVVELVELNTNTVVGSFTTLADGKYSFDNLIDWQSGGNDYEIRVKSVPTGYQHSYGPGPTGIMVDASAGTVAILPIGYDGSFKITGRLFYDANDNYQRDSGEGILPTIPVITMQLRSITNPLLILASQPVLVDGSYELTGVPPGEYTVEVTAASRALIAASPQRYRPNFDYDDPTGNVVTPHTATVKVNAITRSSLADVNFGYVYGGTIEAAVYVDTDSNNVLSGGDAPFSGVDVTLNWTDSGTGLPQTLVKSTDATGVVTFNNLDPAVTDYQLVTRYGLAAGNGATLAQALFSYAGAGNYVDPASSSVAGGDVTLDVDLSGITVTKADAYFGFRINNQPVTITKKAGKDSAHIGEFVPYTITVTNNGTEVIEDISVKDYIPAGFKYVKGSARYTNLTTGETRKFVADPVNARPIVFEKFMNLDPGSSARITYLLVVGAGVTLGDYVNKAHAINQFGFQNSNVAQATVKVTGDPLFDDSLIFGKVFWDKNRDGRQDKDEPGVGGVKLITARGEIITTDESGRYHLADVSGGRWERGTNFILKLDVRSLPQGLTTTTENPIVTRLSLGLPSRINFGVEVPPPVAARLSEQLALAKAEEVKKIEEKLLKEEKFVVESIHFAFDKEQIEAEFENTLDSLAEVLRLHPEWKIRIEGHTDSLGTEAYNKELSQRRANAVKAYLLKTGVNSAQLVDAVGLGLGEPIADNGTPEGRYKNRRVEFKLEK